MDFFMEHEELVSVQNMWDFQEGEHAAQAQYVEQSFAKLEIFQGHLLQYAQESIFPVAFFDDDELPSNESASRQEWEPTSESCRPQENVQA